MREFRDESKLYNGNLALALAPALTPKGIEKDPIFFKGDIVNPLIFSRGLIVLSDIVSTRYFNYVPVALRDPVLSAQGNMLRAECFSACNGVYARLDLFQEGLYGDISYGTTNVDIGTELRKALIDVKQGDKLRLNIGNEGLGAFHSIKEEEGYSSGIKFIRQRPVEMPDRWIRALGNCAEIHRDMELIFNIEGMGAKNFIATLPPVTGKEQAGWLTYTKNGLKLMPRESKDSVYISGIHRLSSLKRLMSDVRSIAFYGPKAGEKGPVMVEVRMDNTNLTLSLTAKSYQGYSGEGALLESLSTLEAVENSDRISELLCFESKIDKEDISKKLSLTKAETDYALGLLAVSGKLGYDGNKQAYFHRELPDEPERVLKDNPRLKAARNLLENTEYMGENRWSVRSKDSEYRVFYDGNETIEKAKCTCTWYLKYQNSRGPCKHILAAKLKSEEK